MSMRQYTNNTGRTLFSCSSNSPNLPPPIRGDGKSLESVEHYHKKEYSYPCLENKTLYFTEEIYAYLRNIDKKIDEINRKLDNIK